MFVLGLFGTAHALVFDIPEFQIGGEIDEGVRFSPLYSAATLLGCGVLCAILADRRHAEMLLPWLGLAFVFTFMTADELAQIHERVEDALNTEWQLVYLPLLLTAAVCWLGVLAATLERPLAFALWLGGGAAWLVARIIDTVPWDEQAPRSFDYDHLFAGVEEVLEIAGNSAPVAGAAPAVGSAGRRLSTPAGPVPWWRRASPGWCSCRRAACRSRRG